MNRKERRAAIDFNLRRMAPAREELARRQQYYQFDKDPLEFKMPPDLDRGLLEAMKREGLDKKYRFVWGGVVLVRDEAYGRSFTLARGSMDACMPDSRTGMTPKYLFRRQRQLKTHYYFNDQRKRVNVPRADMIPEDRISLVEYQWIDFGILRWFLEVRQTGAQLKDINFFSAGEDIPAEDWVTVSMLQTKNALYYQPDVDFVEVLRKREYQNRNADLKQVGAADAKAAANAREEREKQAEIAAKAEFDLLYDDIARRRGQIIGVPN